MQAGALDVYLSLDITFMESIHGATKTVVFNSGSQRQPMRRETKVTIPPGTPDGSRFLYRQEGRQGSASLPPGDLEIEIQVAADKHFSRERNDIYSELPIDMFEASLGSKKVVKTVWGDVWV